MNFNLNYALENLIKKNSFKNVGGTAENSLTNLTAM